MSEGDAASMNIPTGPVPERGAGAAAGGRPRIRVGAAFFLA